MDLKHVIFRENNDDFLNVTVHDEDSAQEASFERGEQVEFTGCYFFFVFVWALEGRFDFLADPDEGISLDAGYSNTIRITRLPDV